MNIEKFEIVKGTSCDGVYYDKRGMGYFGNRRLDPDLVVFACDLPSGSVLVKVPFLCKYLSRDGLAKCTKLSMDGYLERPLWQDSQEGMCPLVNLIPMLSQVDKENVLKLATNAS